jgi:RNA polymerase sigma-70 factor (ECF subfamily)
MCGPASNAERDTTRDDRAERLRQAGEADYLVLFRRVSVLVYRLCGRLRRDEVADRVQEVLNEAVKRALQSAEHFDPERSATAWLIGIALRILQEQRRSARKRAVVESDLGGQAWRLALEELATAADSDATTIRLDVRQALGRLDEQQRRAVELRYFEGQDGEELARALEAPSVGAARVRLARALQALRRQFDSTGRQEGP